VKKEFFSILLLLSIVTLFSTITVLANGETEYSPSYNFTYLLDDATFDEDQTKDGSEWFTVCDLRDNTGEIAFFKWNISEIPPMNQ
jgi:hypothetical protein